VSYFWIHPWFIYLKFMTTELCTRHSKEITVLDIIETLKNLKIRNSFHDLK